MFQDKFVFSQLTSFLDRNHFNYITSKYDGNKYVKRLTCWNQLLALMFGQLCNRESLRDVIVAQAAPQDQEVLGHYGERCRIQISAAITAYCLVAIVQHDMKLKRSTYEVLQILSISLTDKTPLRELFDKTYSSDVKEQLGPLIPGLFD